MFKKKEKTINRGISLTGHREEIRRAEMIRTLPSHVYEIDSNGNPRLVPRNEEVAKKEREWNAMYDKTMALFREARKSRRAFRGISEEYVNKIDEFADEFYEWVNSFCQYEKEVQPVISDRREYIIKARYLWYYVSHTVNVSQQCESKCRFYNLNGSYGSNPIGCQVLFSGFEIKLLLLYVPFCNRPLINPHLLSFFNKLQSKHLKGKLSRLSPYSYSEFSDSHRIPKDEVTQEELDGMLFTDEFYSDSI